MAAATMTVTITAPADMTSTTQPVPFVTVSVDTPATTYKGSAAHVAMMLAQLIMNVMH